jgi:hypothetical protein
MQQFLQCAPYFTERAPMDFVYLLLLIVLCAATLGLLLICDRLSPRK